MFSFSEILYDFRVEIAPSGIPNSGLGAFLTFVGARNLKVEADRKKTDKVCQPAFLPEDELTAAGESGSGINVKLVGDSIYDSERSKRPHGIGPYRCYDEADYEPSPGAVFSRLGDGNGLVRK